MVAPESGTYNVVHVDFNKYLDLYGSFTAPGTPLIGWPANDARNQRWVLETGGEYYTIRSLLTTDLFGRPAQHSAGAKVMAGPSEHYELVEVETGKFRIKVKNENLYWILRDGNDGTQVELQPAGWGNDLWYLNQLDN